MAYSWKWLKWIKNTFLSEYLFLVEMNKLNNLLPIVLGKFPYYIHYNDDVWLISGLNVVNHLNYMSVLGVLIIHVWIENSKEFLM